MRNDNRDSIIWGGAAAICVAFFWSGWIVISRLGVTNNLTAYDLTGLRHGIGAVVALPYIIWSRAWRGLTPLRTLILTVTAGVPYALLAYFGFVYAPAAHGGVFMNGCLPIFTTIFTWIWVGQRSRFSQIVGLGIILIGIILVGYEGFESSGSGMTWLGDCLFLAAIALLAVFMVANRVWSLQAPARLSFRRPLSAPSFYTPIWLFWLDSNLAAAPQIRNPAAGGIPGFGPQCAGHILP